MSSEPQVIEEPTATDENKPLPPAVNGNGITQPQPLSNGVIGTTKTDAEDSSSLLSPLEVSLPNSSSQDTATTTSTEGLVSTKPVSQTSPGLHADSSSTQPEKEAAVSKAETTAVITNEATNVDVPAQVSSEPSDLQPSPSTNPRSQDFQGESKPSSVDTTTETPGLASESLPPTSARQQLPQVPQTEEASASLDIPAPASVPETGAIPCQTHPMADAPPASPTKVPRERDEDSIEEPSPKRTKTDDTTGDTAPEFKVPELRRESTATGHEAWKVDAPLTAKQSKFLVRCIQGLKRVHDSRFFREPVDPVKLNIPNYPLIIKQPMDLRTIEEKLKAGSYTSLFAVTSDFDLMVDNSVTFNGPEHVVSMEGANLKQSFERHLAKLPGPDEVETSPAQKKAQKVAAVPTKTQPARRDSRASGTNARPTNATSPTTTFALGPEGLPLIRRDSTTADGRPKRSIHPPKNRDLIYSAKPKKKKFQWELKFCQEVLDELHKKKYESIAIPFYYPVDPVALNIPTYHSIIKKPMDLQTVQTKLQTGQYENAKEMEADVRLIFKNCYKFNIPGDPTYNSGKSLEEVFDNKWSQKRRWIEAHEPSSGHQSAGTSDNPSDSEGEESEDENDQEKLHQLQKQIAAMSKQVEAITQKKKKTPPSSSKKAGKSKSSKKETKKGSGTTVGSSGKKDKKSGSKSSKPEKQHWVTYREKQIISHGISSLPEKRMTEALKIIQSNVPGLKDTKEAEIELDIDELPNDVLLVLLKFVKKHAPSAMDIDEPEPEPVAVVAPPKPKKNKPMSKYEQEARINSIEGTISRFQGGGGGGRGRDSSQPIQSVEGAESSEDDDSEESEEE
ncbi:transcription regulator BDF1 [Histoplasma capsulatum var. duboisii H88]|uniref:Transcription regulator BDF1 n=1 Tax=Ajellomyces capsulatus (strain H88) TaxID=544711 RepID=F0UCI6_AJEC8|nr:transcription regulator BDF1 [Histoplasma capsulatum var. duboisii H88]